MKTKPTKKKIVEYWQRQGEECVLDFDADAHETCWRCCNKSNLDRCHIVPESLNGSSHPSNFVLLCKRCHGEAPNIADPKFMWIWLYKTGGPMYWELRGAEEYRKMFGREPLARLEEIVETIEISEDMARAMIKEELKKTIRHFGEGRLNPSTMASVFFKIEEKLLKGN